MPGDSQHDVTVLLQAWSDGDESALERLTPLVYAELHRLARNYMGGERQKQTLETGGLVNEAYIRLVDWKNVRWQNRAHFFAVSAQMMRRILVDYARSRGNQKRGGSALRVSIDDALVFSEDQSADFVALDDALERLAKMDARKSRVV
jgi:RNA polymerase sigma factor (TIGR02999 family)